MCGAMYAFVDILNLDYISDDVIGCMELECHSARRINCTTLRCTVNGLIVPTVNLFLWSTAAIRRCDKQQCQGCKNG